MYFPNSWGVERINVIRTVKYSDIIATLNRQIAMSVKDSNLQVICILRIFFASYSCDDPISYCVKVCVAFES